MALNLAEKTVKNYMGVLLDKLNARNRLEALLAAQRLPQIRQSEIRRPRRCAGSVRGLELA